MAIHVTIRNPTQRRFLRLFRGEAPERLDAVRRGIIGREPALAPDTPGLRALALEGIPPDLVPDLAAEIIYEHVVRGSSRSPFVSFSASEQVAVGFALAGGQRHRGLLIVADVEIAEEHVVEAHPTWRYGSFADHARRPWIRVDGCNVGADAIVREAVVRRVQPLGRGDAEYLMLGRMSRAEFRLFEINNGSMTEITR
ncbi:MAG: hypothetical protein U0234_17965 [Sandaracinus sp.]